MTDPRCAVRRLLLAAWNEERFIIRFWTAFVPLALVALFIWWVA